jgi:hypothetical protein
MSLRLAFEVQIQHQSGWRIVTVTRDRDHALTEATYIHENEPRIRGVRVIEEAYDPATNTASERTIYRRATTSTVSGRLYRGHPRPQRKNAATERSWPRWPWCAAAGAGVFLGLGAVIVSLMAG